LQELRGRLIAELGHRCMNCGQTGVKVELHHRNHDHTDNRLSNLTLLCKECHARAGLRLF
jgi:5-methylcytosine-specific restriction endonuclease McrA